MEEPFILPEFPRSCGYHPEWIKAGVSGGAHPLWLTEWLASALALRPGMRVLDLGCGRALSSIFLHREFGVQVWAVDLWFSVTENWQRVRDAGFGDGVFPIHADARWLPFAAEFFDAIISIDSFVYYGTEDQYLHSLVRLVKLGCRVGIAGAGLMQEIPGPVPQHLAGWWTPELWGLHSAAWWRRHWERTELIDIDWADTLPNGWRLWRDWHLAIAPENRSEIEALEADQGRYLGYVGLVAARRAGVQLPEPIQSVSTQYTPKPLLRSQQ